MKVIYKYKPYSRITWTYEIAGYNLIELIEILSDLERLEEYEVCKLVSEEINSKRDLQKRLKRVFK